MRVKPKIYHYKTLLNLVNRLRDDLNNLDFVLLFAYNGTGKTRISMAFKDVGKNEGEIILILFILTLLLKTYFIGITTYRTMQNVYLK